MNEGSPIMYHGNGYGGGVYMVPGQIDRSRQYPLEMLQVLSSAGRGNGEHGQGAPRRWQARRERQPSNKDNTAFSYDSDDSSLSSNASGSNKSSEKGEGSSRAERSTAQSAGDAAPVQQQREWRARPKRDFRPRRIPLERFATAAYPSQIKFTPDDLLNGSKWDSLSQEIWDKFMKSQQTDETFRKKMNLWRYLSMAIRSMFPRYSLYVVGSTMSGFGLDNSDMDLCLHVRAHQHVDARAQALLHLNYLLDYIRTFDSGAELIHAKVPILKFRDVRNGLQVDLNCNNVVGIRNTDMLIYFSRLDWRVRPLVTVTKLWARAHRINDARRRTLSSYALTLMVIHYLQCGTSPPLLVRPEAAHERRAHHNRATLAELFLHMLKYYADFPYEQMAISVRVKRLPLAECRVHDPHQWKWLCVEEPFDLSNTARSVYDPDMFEKIVSTFRESYKRLSAGMRLADAWPAAPHAAPHSTPHAAPLADR
ncbi:PREDICTED: poly(A) RNA polymerase gld-2 homolog A-like [Papilio xuthus]|uniref:Poly(A) RNA polymerase gld-2 homolog A-like n=1 Tax=Papilio xuthus TaxID=66420 RepID=A0AAJ6ZD92_PAPXU|nr:PREDICTED: poly(A) RNA polymerase gld-2 homolog A-like [Papilio xuthus]